MGIPSLIHVIGACTRTSLNAVNLTIVSQLSKCDHNENNQRDHNENKVYF